MEKQWEVISKEGIVWLENVKEREGFKDDAFVSAEKAT